MPPGLQFETAATLDVAISPHSRPRSWFVLSIHQLVDCRFFRRNSGPCMIGSTLEHFGSWQDHKNCKQPPQQDFRTHSHLRKRAIDFVTCDAQCPHQNSLTRCGRSLRSISLSVRIVRAPYAFAFVCPTFVSALNPYLYQYCASQLALAKEEQTV